MMDTVRLSEQTVDNLRDYLARFPANTPVTVWYDYKEYDCQICANTEWQKETGKVQLMLGRFIADS